MLKVQAIEILSEDLNVHKLNSRLRIDMRARGCTSKLAERHNYNYDHWPQQSAVGMHYGYVHSLDVTARKCITFDRPSDA